MDVPAPLIERVFEIRYDRWCGWLLALLGMGRRFSGVAVSEGHLEVRLGWAFRGDIPGSSIVAIEPYAGRVWGWGVHGWGGRWLVNGSSHGIVQIDFDPAARGRVCGVGVRLRTLLVSVDDSAGLVQSVRVNGRHER